MTADVGPVEYVVIDFPGNRFNGAVAPAIAKLVEQGHVRILDLVFVKKDATGLVTTFEYDELEEGSPFASVDGEVDGMVNDLDLQALAESVPHDSSALFILWEDLWAAELGAAIRASDGELLDGGRIPHQVVEEIRGAIESEGN